MPPRIPNETRRESTCENLRELASAYMPTLRFARGERFYPARAESWLTQATVADWPETRGRHGEDLPLDGHRRGTAVVRADAVISSIQLLAGTPAYERPLSLDPADGSDNAIARFAGVGEDTFLSFGGWADNENRSMGDEQYLYRSFSELAGAMEPEVAWQPLDIDPGGAPHLPNMWFPQPVTPTVYAEIRWAGAYSWLAEDRGLDDFPRGPNGSRVADLDVILAITYHYLYPARHPINDQSAPTRIEGQWEAVTIFLPAVRREQDRPDDEERLFITEPPRFVAVSQGLDAGVHRVDIRPWNQVRKLRIGTAPPSSVADSTSVVLFVGRGTHFFHFEPQEGHDWADEPPPGSDLSLDLDEDLFWLHFFLTLFFLVYTILWIVALVTIIGAVIAAATVLAAIGLALLALLVLAIVVVALALLIAALFALFSDHGSDATPHPSNEEATGNGPQGGSSESPAGDPHEDATGGGAGGGGGSGGGAPAGPGTPNVGSPTGRDIAAFDLRVVDLINHPRPTTAFPPGDRCEHPAWWGYTGGWGVRVRQSISAGWGNGMRRIDESGRSWGYYHAKRVIEELDRD